MRLIDYLAIGWSVFFLSLFSCFRSFSFTLSLSSIGTRSIFTHFLVPLSIVWVFFFFARFWAVAFLCCARVLTRAQTTAAVFGVFGSDWCLHQEVDFHSVSFDLDVWPFFVCFLVIFVSVLVCFVFVSRDRLDRIYFLFVSHFKTVVFPFCFINYSYLLLLSHHKRWNVLSLTICNTTGKIHCLVSDNSFHFFYFGISLSVCSVFAVCLWYFYSNIFRLLCLFFNFRLLRIFLSRFFFFLSFFFFLCVCECMFQVEGLLVHNWTRYHVISDSKARWMIEKRKNNNQQNNNNRRKRKYWNR